MESGRKAGAPGGDRTHNLRLRRPTLYPIELQARDRIIIKKLNKTAIYKVFAPICIGSLVDGGTS